jgi:deoxyribose-phosphate aldolase
VQHQYERIAKRIDHALLKPDLTDRELDDGCDVAIAHAVASVCIVPHALGHAVAKLRGSGVEPSTVVGFPHGTSATEIKVLEAARALDDGATELDMVVNVGKVKSLDYSYVEREVGLVLARVRDAGAKLKVIFECWSLERQHVLELCRICAALEVDWVKTSTGFGSGGATPEHVRWLRAHTPARVQVKASGGIRTLDQLLAFEALGASRIGTSGTVQILGELRQRLEAADAQR